MNSPCVARAQTAVRWEYEVRYVNTTTTTALPLPNFVSLFMLYTPSVSDNRCLKVGGVRGGAWRCNCGLMDTEWKELSCDAT